MYAKLITTLFLSFLFILTGHTQVAPKLDSDMVKGLKFRSIGPALMSGRIADIAIDPHDENRWYVAVGSGNVWKTENAGVTWKAIFDNQSVYSTGCITIDPSNNNTIWLGTGENVGGRHVSWGDGIYRSQDAGNTWENMGLKKSEHISKIIVHPTDPNTLWVASQGPLWSKGGERGIYKTTDGGKHWTRTLGDNEWTGATDLLIDPRNPDRLYAATWQRHRTVGAYLGGGPETAIYRSEDGGVSWTKLSSGLPESNMGKIGIALSPQQPDVIYAAIELDLRKGGVYKSTDRGTTWTKQSDAVSGATGPHYYQELYACPHNFDRLYLMDWRMQISDDGGKSFRKMKEKYKHSDNHSINFKMDDPDYLLVGTDGGIYESFDLAENWRFMANLPLTQFYKIAVDDAEPFYNVYGGTQDNSTEGGPSRTDNVNGIQNSDWSVVLNWDGHQPATEPGNPDIMYGQRQQGTLSRIDLKTGEVIDIQPQPGKDEDYERFNWDAPILVSPHDPAQIFFASQRLWRSNDRGNSWTALSNDLTRNESVFDLPMMGKIQSWDNAWDLSAMSNYNTISSIAESPVQRDLIYIGTDDGLIHVTENNGGAWRKMDVSRMSGVPSRAYVNDIKADLFDANVAYAVLDDHKTGDYNPYIFKTSDKGKSWQSIKSNLPDGTIIWRIVQDHVNKDLLFIGTEFGIYFTVNGGKEWTQLKGGLPTISFRDLQIQRRENDLVAGSFGRSIYILDDYTALREMNSKNLNQAAALFPVKDAWWYVPRSRIDFDDLKGSLGEAHYAAENPAFGATFNYYVKETRKSLKDQRKEKEKKMTGNIPFPGFDALDSEVSEPDYPIWFVVSNSDGEVVRKLSAKQEKGVHRITWDLRYPSYNAIGSGNAGNSNSGLLAPPGDYQVQLMMSSPDGLKDMGDARSFKVKPMYKGTLQADFASETNDFWRSYESLTRDQSRAYTYLNAIKGGIKALKSAYQNAPSSDAGLMDMIMQSEKEIKAIDISVSGSPSKNGPGVRNKPTIGGRMFALYRSISNTTAGPTKTNLETLGIIKEETAAFDTRLMKLEKQLNTISDKIVSMGGPYVSMPKR